MQKQNPTIKLQLFKEKMDASQPIKLSNLTEVNTGAIFFNSNRGSCVEDVFAVLFMNTPVDDLKLIDIKGKFSGTFNLKGCIRWLKEPVQTSSGKLVRDAMLADNTFNVPISVWGDTISEIQEENYYKLTNVGAKNYFGQKLFTKDETKVIPLNEESSPQIQWEEIDMNPSPPTKAAPLQLDNPLVNSCKISFYPICTTVKCRRKRLTVIPGDETIECKQCGKGWLLETAKCSFNGEIQFEHNDSEISLTIFEEVLGKYFGEDIIAKYKDNTKQLRLKILKMKNIQVKHTVKRVITSITDIGDEQ